MNWRDEELLRQVAEADHGLRYFVLALLHHSDDGELPAQGMRVLGERYSELGTQLLHRADVLQPGSTRWWRSNRDGRVHAWPVPLQPPYQREAACGHTAWDTDVTRNPDGEPCFDCADETGELHRIAQWDPRTHDHAGRATALPTSGCPYARRPSVTFGRYEQPNVTLGRSRGRCNLKPRHSRLGYVVDASVAQRLRVALDIYQFGEQMQRSRLRREHPDATEQEIEALVREWRCAQPSAPHGDASGLSARRFA